MGLNKTVSNAFWIGFFDPQFHDDTAIECVTIHFWKGEASEDGIASEEGEEPNKGKDFVYPSGEIDVVEL